jgi:hypothetical protein
LKLCSKVSLVLANQYLAQLPDDLKGAVFGKEFSGIGTAAISGTVSVSGQ